MLDDLGFEAAITSYATNFTKKFRVPCDLLLDREDHELDELLATSIFRIVQESLTNSARHVRSSHAMAALQDRGDELLLSIVDDGCGMSAELTGEKKTFGMLGIRERVTMPGGRILIGSAPGRGTHIEVSLPKSEQPIRQFQVRGADKAENCDGRPAGKPIPLTAPANVQIEARRVTAHGPHSAQDPDHHETNGIRRPRLLVCVRHRTYKAMYVSQNQKLFSRVLLSGHKC